ncbi:hypothetical protein Mal64_04850 [Pseudobythopirellula maris]|uniref:PSP1 C-terminal domain-containing protein n=1 Tax=Pseudobythopirellula maris TaxID=2527991 RepID=A0A5C5ZRC2_9BACT|nr:regulatory iron-sulfur-containing complex subunit RicT [Pseudobythopirellula maris]TWT90102.1 hypothetical protein Mal64_04850 [Pseudobythopirellula maris]
MPKYVVRHGSMRSLGVFSTRSRDTYARGHQVIARTSRGLETGEVLCEASEHVLSQMKAPKGGQILRLASTEDEVEIRRMGVQQATERELSEQKSAELGLELKVVDVERLYGGERVVIYYLADERVDFRDLVKILAKEFQTRVEMCQIGVRDEAKLLADYGDCGKPVCCNTHLSDMPPVSMKMAKLQKATLDPTKISGRCGRLKCCLRYEYDTYRDMQRELPRVGAQILTNNGRAKVLSQQILSGELLVQTEDSRRVVIHSSDVLTVLETPKESGGAKGGPKSGGASKGGGAKGGGAGKQAAKSEAGADKPKPKPPASSDKPVAQEKPVAPEKSDDRSPSTPPGEPPASPDGGNRDPEPNA